MPQTEAEAMQF